MSVLPNISKSRIPSDAEIVNVLQTLHTQVETEQDEKHQAKLLRDYRILSYLVATGKRVSEVALYSGLSPKMIVSIVKANCGNAIGCAHDLRKAYYLRLQKIGIEESVREELIGHRKTIP